jgi:hypothetical protein
MKRGTNNKAKTNEEKSSHSGRGKERKRVQENERSKPIMHQ